MGAGILSRTPVYSPNQCSFGAFLGGPLASIWCIRRNFQVLGEAEAVRKTSLYGALVMAALFILMPMLPDRFPNFVIPLVTIIMTRGFVQAYQSSKQAIAESELLAFRSNWSVLGVGLSCLAITVVAFMGYMIALDDLGIIHLAG